MSDNAEETRHVKIIKTACNMCPCWCGININMDRGEIVKITGMPEHPFHTLCVKAQGITDLAYSKERITNPLKKVNGMFKEISWDEAFGFVIDKMVDIKQKHGAKAVVFHLGVPFIWTPTEYMIRRFADLYGTPNYTSGASFCMLARTIAESLVIGMHVLPNYSADNRCILVWGFNPRETWPPLADAIHSAVWRGTKLIVIDPRKTPLAREADIHAQIRPGTDCALGLGMLNVIIAEELYHKAFVKQWTVGFNQLVEHVKDYSPERVEQITWVPAQIVRNIARIYATHKPGIICPGISLDHSSNGIQALRAITVLITITGNLDVPGGSVTMARLKTTSLRLEEKIAKDVAVGDDYPLFTKFAHEQTVVPVTEHILTEKPYPVKAIINIGCNPILTWPNTNKVRQAFEKLDLLLVSDIFMTDTAKVADVILPGTTFLEREDLRLYVNRGLHLLFKTNRVLEPAGNSMEDWKIWAELGKRMGYADYFPWQNTHELFDYLLKDSNLSLEQIKDSQGCIYYYDEPQFQKYLQHGFNTPSGKVEIYSETLEKLGYDPLPNFHEPTQSPVSQPDLAEKYPLILSTGPRVAAFLHSQFRNLPRLRRLEPQPLVEINPQTADSYGIIDGDLIRVESTTGSIEIKAKFTDDIHPKMVVVRHGWSEANANYLTDDKDRDPISGYPAFRARMCRIMKIGRVL